MNKTLQENNTTTTTNSRRKNRQGILERYFQIKQRQTTVATEIRAGLVTFVTMAYIMIVNASMLSRAGTPEHPFPFPSIVTATALAAAFGTGMAGLCANLPITLAAGMGLNAVFTYEIVHRIGVSWNVGLTITFFQGILFMVASVTGICSRVQQYAPTSIKKSITVGLGLFQALVGYEMMNLVIDGRSNGTLLSLGDLSDARVYLGITCFFFTMTMLVLNVKAAILLGMIGTTLIAWAFDIVAAPTHFIEMPTLHGTFLALDFANFFIEWRQTIPMVFVLLFVAIFDTAGVQFAAGMQANLLNAEGKLPGSTIAFFAAATATTLGSLLGTSSVIIHNESIAGIQDGARTGLSSLVVAACFLLSLPIVPVLSNVPDFATAPSLIIVGLFMMSYCRNIAWDRLEEACPAFLTVTLLPMTYSITTATISGVFAYVAFIPVAKLRSDIIELPRRCTELEEAATEATPILGTYPQPLASRSLPMQHEYVSFPKQQNGIQKHSANAHECGRIPPTLFDFTIAT